MLKMIAKLGDIPVGATVTKLGGTQEYVVRDRITIYREGEWKEKIHAGEGCLFLVGLNGSSAIEAFGTDKEFIWFTNLEWLNNLEAEKVGRQ